MRKNILTLLIVLLSLNSFGQTFGNAIHLNGQDDYLTIPNNSNLNPTNTITIEAWIKPCDTTGTKTIISKNWCPNNNSYNLHLRSGRLDWVWSASADCGLVNKYQSNVAVQPNVWQHVAVVHTSSSVTFYINGNVVAGTLLNGNYSNLGLGSEPLRIGTYKGLSGNFGHHFNGHIDEVRIWNTALPASEILSRYNSQLQGNETGLIAYYDMNTNTINGSNIMVPNNSSIGSNLNATTTGTNSTPKFNAYVESYCEGEDPNSLTNYFKQTRIYPNPTTNEVIVDFEDFINNVNATFYNTSGQKLLSTDYKSVNSIRLSLASFAKGIYFLQLRSDSGESKTIKLLKE